MANDAKRLERRLNGLKQSLNDVREAQESLEEDVSVLQEQQEQTQDQLADIRETMDGYQEYFREQQVHEHRIDELEMQMKSKIGMSTFETLQEQVRQLRARVDFIGDVLDPER